jgi:hypothetical protein
MGWYGLDRSGLGGPSGGLLWTWWWIFGFLKMLGSSWVAAQLAASQEGLSSVSKYWRWDYSRHAPWVREYTRTKVMALYFVDTGESLRDGHGLQGKDGGNLWYPVAPAFVLIIVEDRKKNRRALLLIWSHLWRGSWFPSAPLWKRSRREVGFDDVVSFIPLSIPTLGLLLIAVNVISQHSGSEAFPI